MSKIEVNEIVKASGSTLTIGGSGTAVTLGTGATQTGFGRTGSVDWETTAKTASFTAESGKGYFVNTTGNVITLTLPASPSAGAIVAIKDYAGTFATNNLTIGRNGSNIEGNASDSVVSTNLAALVLVYVDGTKGWLDVNTEESRSPKYVSATGGNTTATCGNYKIHTFTSPGTFTVSCAGNAAGIDYVDYLVVAGGASGAGNPCANAGGGGGAGGFRESRNSSYTPAWTASPLVSTTSISVSAQGYPITVGAGGAGAQNDRGNCCSASTFSTITSAGGGIGGGPIPGGCGTGANGGSGGGGGGGSSAGSTGGNGNTPPTTPPQGNNGGNCPPSNSPDHQSGAGGGAGAVGGSASGGTAGVGGTGVTTHISGSPLAYAGGGGGSGLHGTVGTNEGLSNGSSCGTGGQGFVGVGNPGTASDGTANRGGGGGSNEGYNGSPNNATGGSGGSGVVIIRYKFQ